MNFLRGHFGSEESILAYGPITLPTHTCRNEQATTAPSWQLRLEWMKHSFQGLWGSKRNDSLELQKLMMFRGEDIFNGQHS